MGLERNNGGGRGESADEWRKDEPAYKEEGEKKRFPLSGADISKMMQGFR